MAYTMAGAYKSFYTPKYRTNRAFKAPKAPIQPTIPAGFEQVYKDMMAYNGTFTLILNIRSAIARYGKLTDKQWAALKKCLTPQPAQDPSVVLVDTCNIPIIVSPSAARYIAKTHNWPLNPCTLVVTQIKSHDRRSLTMMVKMDWSSNVSVCRCCGKSLTDWKSQATGVGPYCVKRTSIQYVRNKADVARFQKEMEDLCSKIGEVEVVVKKWHIREGLDSLSRAVSSSSPTKIEVKVPDVLVFPLTYCDWNDKERVLTLKEHLVPAVDSTTSAIGIHNRSTNKTVNFIRHAAIRTDNKVKFISTELDNPITLYITK
jgi:hypothetical protein